MSSSDEDDGMSLAALKAEVVKKKTADTKQAIAAENLSSSDDEDEGMSLAALKKQAVTKARAKAKAPRSAATRVTAKRSKLAVQPASKKKKKAAAKKGVGSKAKSSRASSEGSGSDDSYLEVFRSKTFRVSKVVKKHLVEGVLIRWSYVVEWPPRSAVLPQPPDGFVMLRGYPGVYVGVHGEKCGQVMDNRSDTTNVPSFANFMKKSPEQLKALLQEAILKQIEDLKQHDGPQRLLSDLELELKNVGKLNASKVKAK